MNPTKSAQNMSKNDNGVRFVFGFLPAVAKQGMNTASISKSLGGKSKHTKQ